MGKQTNLTASVTFQVSPVMLKQLNKAAEKDGRSVSSYVRVALAAYLRKQGGES